MGCTGTKTQPSLDDASSILTDRQTSEGSHGGSARESHASSGGLSRTGSQRNVGEAEHRAAGGAVGKPFPKRPLGCKLSKDAWHKLEQLFRKMDPDGSNAVTREEAQVFFKGAFAKLSADAMFNEVDVDGSGAIDADEFVKFWIHVRKAGYKDGDIVEELDLLIEGSAWRDFNDGQDTSKSRIAFPKRPILSRISAKCWGVCEELFRKIEGADGSNAITREKAHKHFTKGGGFVKTSVDAMFNEIDPGHHGQISPKEWMKFWVQVKASGYKEQDILDELESLMEGNSWVDWKDGRRVA